MAGSSATKLVERGYAVLAVDALGWGDRSGLTYEAQQALASNFFNLGSSLAGLVAREDVRAVALLRSLPEIDRTRIATVGFSMGGWRAWQTAALSPYVSATVSVCWMTTLKEMMVVGNNTLRGQSAYFMSHPGLYEHLDIPDVASIAAPRPAFFLNGELDPLFTPAGTLGAYTKMRAVWRSQRAEDRLRTTIWPGWATSARRRCRTRRSPGWTPGCDPDPDRASGTPTGPPEQGRDQSTRTGCPARNASMSSTASPKKTR